MNAPTTRQNSRGTSRTLHTPICSGGGRGVTSHGHLTKLCKNLEVINLFCNFAHVSGFCGRCEISTIVDKALL